MPEKSASKTPKQLAGENEELRVRLEESEEILRAIRSGEVDALIVSGVGGEKILTFQEVEEALRLSEEKYRTLVEGVTDGFYLSDEAGIFTFANPALAGIYGVETPQSLVGRRFLDFVVPEMLEELGEVHRKSMQAGHSPAVINSQILRPDGTRAYIEVKSASILKGDQIVGSRGVVRDITERKRAEEALRLSEEKYRTLINEVNDGFFRTDNDGVFTFANPALARIYGVESPQALVGRKISDFQASKKHMILGEAFRSAMQTGHAPALITGEILRPDGQTAFIEFKPAMIVENGRVVGSQGVVRDVTERNRAEEALRLSETEYRGLFENSMTGISQALPNGRLIRANSAYSKMYGYANPEEMMAEVTHIDRLYANPEDREDVLRILADRGVMEPREMTVIRRDGTRIVVLVGAREIRDSEGNLRFYQAEHVEVTARKQAEEELRQSEARFRILFEKAADIILQLEIMPNGNPVIREVNNAALRVLGYERDELIGQPVTFLEGTPDAYQVVQERRQTLRDGRGMVFEVKHRCKDGTIRDFESSVVEMKVGSKTLAISVERDVTDRTRSVDQIRRQLEHLTAMSAIDRVIASNFNLSLSLSEILKHVTTELGVDAADILILDPISQTLEFCVEQGFHTKASSRKQIRLGEGYAGRAAMERQLVQVSNFGEETEKGWMTGRWKDERFACYFGVPLISKGQVKGVLEVLHRIALKPDPEWFDFLNALAGQTAIAIENSTLFESLQRSNMDLALAYDATIEGWSHALDLRDKETEGHTQRVTEMTVKLAHAFGLSEEELVQVRWGALLHDIGKMGVPDAILHKPGSLTDEEWVAMRKHPTFANEMLTPIRYLRGAVNIPYCHHEKWDGTGYPRGLKGAQIPLTARIFAVVDVWDALRSDRPYRAAWTDEKVREYIQNSSGTHFDPQVVELFLRKMDSLEGSSKPV